MLIYPKSRISVSYPTIVTPSQKPHHFPPHLILDELPLHVDRAHNDNETFTEVDDVLRVARRWASSHSSRQENATTVDVISVGSANGTDRMQMQQRTWASTREDSPVRNVFLATEINTDNVMMPNNGGGRSCRELTEACNGGGRVEGRSENETLRDDASNEQPSSSSILLRYDDEEWCLKRRMGLAMGASASRYRKIARAIAR